MAKKKKAIDLRGKNLEFSDNTTTYKLLRFKPQDMTLDTIRYEDGVKVDEFNIPFAHLPKDLKKIVKPN